MDHVTPETLRFASRGSRTLAATVWVVLGFGWWGAWPMDGPSLQLATLITVSVVTATIPVLWRPSLIISPHGIHVDNPLATHVLPWSAIQRIDTRFTVQLVTEGKTIALWAGVAPGRHRSFWATKDQGAHLPDSTYQGKLIGPGDLIGSESGEIAAIIRRYWQDHRHTNTDQPATSRADTWACGLLAASALAAVAAALTWAL
jgi:hypothetical protein